MDRRTFLRRAAVTAAATVLAPSVVAQAAEAATRPVDDSKREPPEHPLDVYYRRQGDYQAIEADLARSEQLQREATDGYLFENLTAKFKVPEHWKDNPINARDPVWEFVRLDPPASFEASVFPPERRLRGEYWNGYAWEPLQ